MLKEDVRELKALERSQAKPSLWLTAVPLLDLLGEIRAEHFAGVTQAVSFHFVRGRWLAYVRHNQETADIVMHEVLNLTETPSKVFSFILKHELLHLVIPPREVKGRMTPHPPEFSEREKAISPEGREAYEWIWRSLGDCLRRNRRKEGIRVLACWKAPRRQWKLSRADFDELYEFGVL
jgi:hypothetical protein